MFYHRMELKRPCLNNYYPYNHPFVLRLRDKSGVKIRWAFHNLAITNAQT